MEMTAEISSLAIWAISLSPVIGAVATILIVEWLS
jgi:hypothetical protein